MSLPQPAKPDWFMEQCRPSVIDLFAGAGGLSLGFARAGFSVEMAVDNCAMAVETHRWNLGGHAQTLDLRAGDPAFPSATVIVGGPPCQGFSSAGLGKRGDHRVMAAAAVGHGCLGQELAGGSHTALNQAVHLGLQLAQSVFQVTA